MSRYLAELSGTIAKLNSRRERLRGKEKMENLCFQVRSGRRRRRRVI